MTQDGNHAPVQHNPLRTTLPHVLVVLAAPIHPHFPNGFSQRWYHFLHALSTRYNISVCNVRRPGWYSSDFLGVPADLPIVYEWDDVTNTRYPHTPFAMRRASFQQVWRKLPRENYPRRLAMSEMWWQRNVPDLVVTMLPMNAHFAFAVPTPTPTLFALEEGIFPRGNLVAQPTDPFRKVWRTLSAVRGQQQARYLTQQIAAQGGLITVISPHEKAHLARSIPAERITVVPHGIDCTYFAPTPVEETVDIGIFGMLNAGRNALPALALFAYLQQQPWAKQLRWAFVGAHPTAEVQALAGEYVEVTGFVEDMRPWYSRTRIVVVPTDSGTGVKTTVLQGWAMGRPVVASEFSAIGLPTRSGENILVGATVAELAAHIRTLLDNPALRQTLALQGRATAEHERDIRVIAQQFVAVCDTARARTTTS